MLDQLVLLNFVFNCFNYIIKSCFVFSFLLQRLPYLYDAQRWALLHIFCCTDRHISPLRTELITWKLFHVFNFHRHEEELSIVHLPTNIHANSRQIFWLPHILYNMWDCLSFLLAILVKVERYQCKTKFYMHVWWLMKSNYQISWTFNLYLSLTTKLLSEHHLWHWVGAWVRTPIQLKASLIIWWSQTICIFFMSWSLIQVTLVTASFSPAAVSLIHFLLDSPAS